MYHDIAVSSYPDRENNVPECTVVPLLGVRSVIERLSLSIRFTVANALPVLPTASINSKVKLPFHVNVYDNQLLFVTVIASDPLIVATTFPLVNVAGL